MAKIGWLLIALCAASAVAAVARRCPIDVADRLVTEAWIVELRFERCSVIDGGARIVAQDRRDGAIYVVARFGELADISLSLGRSDELIVSMPNMIDIEGWENKVKDLSVRAVFLPIDDPEQRAMYQFWMHHPEDAKAKAWYQESIARQISPEVPTGGVLGAGADGVRRPPS